MGIGLSLIWHGAVARRLTKRCSCHRTASSNRGVVPFWRRNPVAQLRRSARAAQLSAWSVGPLAARVHLELHLYRICVLIAAVLAVGRAAGIHYFWLSRLLAYRKRAVATPTSWSDLITYPEPPLLLVLTLFLWHAHSNPAEPSVLELARAGTAAVLALAALGLQIWALRSIPGISPGYYILPEQEVSTAGPYGFVRHPLYLGAIIVWLSIALVFWSFATLLIALLYVVPGYVIYSRSEEEMMNRIRKSGTLPPATRS